MNPPTDPSPEPPCNCIGAGGQIRDRLAWHYVWEYYDGAVSGLCLCREHSSLFLYDLLDWNLKDIGGERVYGIAPVRPSELAILARLLQVKFTRTLDVADMKGWFSSPPPPNEVVYLDEVFRARRDLEWIVRVCGRNPFEDSAEVVIGRADFPREAKWRARRLPNAAWEFRMKPQFDWLAFFKARAENA